MSNLFETLGSDFVSDSFSGCWFMYEGDLYMFDRYSSAADNVLCYKYDKETRATDPVRLDSDVFQDFGIFKTPRLGYRNTNNSVVWLESVRSVQRGFRRDLVSATSIAKFSYYEEQAESSFFYECFNPTFIDYATGVQAIKNNERFGFALNHDLCIAIDVEGISPMAVLFRGNRVGGVDMEGKLTIDNASLMRSKTYNYLQGVAA